MPNFNYQSSANTAKRLLVRFGRTIQHIAVVEGAYDTTTGTVASVETSTNVTACDFDFQTQRYGLMYEATTLIQKGDRFALIGQSVANINVSDKLIIDGVRWNIINVKKLAPASVVTLWNCHIRK